jgi:DNA-binding response OmpR family regulator
MAQQEIELNMEKQLDGEKDYVPFSLLILDYNLPYICGLDIIKSSRELYGQKGCLLPKILLFTAIEDERLKLAALKEKVADYFLIKPASSFELEEILSEVEGNF